MKQLEDYPELFKWFNKHIADSEYLEKEFHFGFEVQDVELKLVEMQNEIERLKSAIEFYAKLNRTSEFKQFSYDNAELFRELNK